MIIWGSKGKEIVLSSGQFYCPNCDATRTYKFKRLAKYFTLYFVPLFQTSNLGEYVECQVCGQTYKPDVLGYQPPSPVEKLLAVVRSELESGMPLHMLVRRLVKVGIDEATATELVQVATGADQKQCSNCGFTFLGTVHVCSNCGCELTQVIEMPSEQADALGVPEQSARVEQLTSGDPEQSSRPGELFCGECGTPNPLGKKFCWKCGHPLHSESGDGE